LQVYPTQVRSFGLGVCNACSRFGALLSPFLTVDLVEHGHPQLAEGNLAVCCAIAAVLTWLLPIETKARSLLVSICLADMLIACWTASTVLLISMQCDQVAGRHTMWVLCCAFCRKFAVVNDRPFGYLAAQLRTCIYCRPM